MRFINNRTAAWIFCAAVGVSTVVAFVTQLQHASNINILKLAGDIAWALLPLVFAILAALILARQPRNSIGWLLMLPGLAVALPVEAYIQSFTTIPSPPPLLLLLSAWFDNWAWLLAIFPILFIPVLFPTGQPLTPRWRWLIRIGLGLCAIFILIVTFSQRFSSLSSNQGWTVHNPIGFLPSDQWGIYFIAPWGVGLLSLTILSVTSLFIRYRRATAIVREQIKWLLFASGLFAVIYVVGIFFEAQQAAPDNVSNLVLPLSILTIPIAISIAILRYRLWDIDIIIRKTLVYGALTATLGLIFFGGVTLLQALFTAISGQQSPISIVVSTLIIAALFTPLRNRIQRDIDRRFFRNKYDAEKTLERFARSARNKADLETLTTELVEAVDETLQPERVYLWLKPSAVFRQLPIKNYASNGE